MNKAPVADDWKDNSNPYKVLSSSAVSRLFFGVSHSKSGRRSSIPLWRKESVVLGGSLGKGDKTGPWGVSGVQIEGRG